jgi:hypothetical protein
MDIESRIRQELLTPKKDDFAINAITELAQRSKDLNEAMVEDMQKLKESTRKLLASHLEEKEKVINNLSEQLELTQNTFQHLLTALTIDADSYPKEAQEAWNGLRDAAKNYFEQRMKN